MIDCSKITDKVQLHKALAEALDFPNWYGNNLDALYDCLTDLEEDTYLELLHFPTWAEGFAQVFRDAMEENPNLHILIK